MSNHRHHRPTENGSSYVESSVATVERQITAPNQQQLAIAEQGPLTRVIPPEELGPLTKEEQNAQIVISTDIPKMEKVRVYNLRDPGRVIEFFYASKTHPLKHYTLLHDHEYTLPYEIIDHLEGTLPGAENSCSEMIYKNETSPDGKMMKSVAQGYKGKYQCKRVRSR